MAEQTEQILPQSIEEQIRYLDGLFSLEARVRPPTIFTLFTDVVVSNIVVKEPPAKKGFNFMTDITLIKE